MQILETERISWKTWMPTKPSDFPCMICHAREATHRVKIREGALTLLLCVCAGCNAVPILTDVIEKRRDIR